MKKSIISLTFLMGMGINFIDLTVLAGETQSRPAAASEAVETAEAAGGGGGGGAPSAAAVEAVGEADGELISPVVAFSAAVAAAVESAGGPAASAAAGPSAGAPAASADRLKHVILGDMHGNPIKLIKSLRTFGFIEASDELVAEIAEFYRRVDIKEDSHTFIAGMNQFFKRLVFKRVPGTKVILIGDLLGDRGRNDYVMLSLLYHMSYIRINFTIVASNHDMCFLEKVALMRSYVRQKIFCHASCYPTRGLFDMNPSCTGSVDSFLWFVFPYQGRPELMNIVDRLINCYFSHLKLCYFYERDSSNPDSFDILVTHAVHGERALKGFNQFSPVLETLEGKAYWDSLNLGFQTLLENLIMGNPELFLRESERARSGGKKRLHGLLRLVQKFTCERYKGRYFINVEKRYSGQLVHIHGHDAPGFLGAHRISLDSKAGKNPYRSLPDTETGSEVSALQLDQGNCPEASTNPTLLVKIQEEWAEWAQKKKEFEER